MKKLSILLTISFGLLINGTANASLIFSNLSYTSNSVTFTIDGDMSGYTLPSSSVDQFRIYYDGDQFIGDSGFEANTWSRSIFDNRTILSNGNTGSNSSGAYSWVRFDSTLVGASVSSALINLTLTNADLDINASNPLFVFSWGNNARNVQTVLGRAVPDGSTSVPSPAPLALLGIGLAGIGFARKRKS